MPPLALACKIGFDRTLRVYCTLAGLFSHSGGEHLLLRPLPVAVRRLGSASAESSMRGGVRLSWSSDEDCFKAEVVLPLGVAAKLHILLPVLASGEHVVLTEFSEGAVVVWGSDLAAMEVGSVPGVLSAHLSKNNTELIVEMLSSRNIPRGLGVRRLALQPGGTGGTPLHGGACHGQMGTVSGPPRRHDRGGATQNLFSSNGQGRPLSWKYPGAWGAPFDTATGRHRRDTLYGGACHGQMGTVSGPPRRYDWGGATHLKPL